MKRPLVLTAVLLLLAAPLVFAGAGPKEQTRGRPIVPLGSGTIIDGNAVFSWNTFGMVNFDNADFTYNGQPDHMFEHSFYYRANADGQEFVLGAPDVQDYTGNVATLDWADVDGRGLFSAQLVSTIVDGGGGAIAQITHELTVTNISITNGNGAPLDLNVFAYLDMDLSNTATDDEGVLVSDPDLMEDFDPDTTFQWGGPGAIEFQAGSTQQPVGSLRSLLGDTNITNLDGTGLPFGPGDMDAAYQWSVNLGPGVSATFTNVQTLFDQIPVELQSFEVE